MSCSEPKPHTRVTAKKFRLLASSEHAVDAHRLHAYPVLYEKPGDLVAHCKCTALVLPSGTTRITNAPTSHGSVLSDKSLDADLEAILSISSKVLVDFAVLLMF